MAVQLNVSLSTLFTCLRTLHFR